MRLVLGLSLLTTAVALSAVENFCNPEKLKNPLDPLDMKMKLPETYKVSGIITDWVLNTTALVTEVATKETRATLMSDRSGARNKVIALAANSFVFVNETAPSCVVSDKSFPIPQVADRIRTLLSSDASSVSAIVADVVKFSQTNKGFYRNESQTMSGVEGVQWVACVDGPAGNTSVQIEVIFAGDGSFKPASAAFDNPLMLFVRFSEFANFSDVAAPVSSTSFELDRFDGVMSSDDALLQISSALTCEGWKTADIPVKFSDPTSVLIQHTDEKGVVSSAKVYHSVSERVSTVCVDGIKSDGVIPFFGQKAAVDGASAFVHDFNTGYQYSLTPSRCALLSAIPSNASDVSIVDGGLSTLRPLSDILINKTLPWGNYGKLVVDGKSLDVWRAWDAVSSETKEVRLEGERLIALLSYRKGSAAPSHSWTFTTAPAPSVTAAMHRARDCFAAQANHNSTFSLNVTGKSFSDVHSVGDDVITAALSSALVKLAPMNPLRLSTFYSSSSDGGLQVLFTVYDKTDKAPAAVSTFNYTTEVSVDDVLAALNDTISKGDWKFTVQKEDKKTENWTVAGSSLSRFPAPPPPPGPAPYAGYTGGSMFVLGIFSLVLGCAIGAGSLFFVTKRQRISTLAYQVFE